MTIPGKCVGCCKLVSKDCTNCGKQGLISISEPEQKVKIFDLDTLTVNFMRFADLDKHKARECARVVNMIISESNATNSTDKLEIVLHTK